MLDAHPKEVKLIIKNFPLPMHQFARKAAAAALAANAQGKFWEFNHKLFENFSSLSDAKIEAIARELKLDLNKFNNDLNSQAVQSLIARDVQEGSEARIPGTPAIFINGKMFKERSFDDIGRIIEAEAKKRKQK